MSRQSKIHQLDRIIIAIIGLISVLNDGLVSDCLMMASMLLWLWLPEWEKKLILIANKKRKQAKKVH